MAKFHINANGDAMQCVASVRPCQFAESDHFDNLAAVQFAAEQRLEETHGITAPPLKKIRNALGKAFRALEDFAESVDTGHKRDMEEIRELAYQRKNTSPYK